MSIMKTIQMTIAEPLLKALDKASRAAQTTRSAFIRDAVVLDNLQTVPKAKIGPRLA